MRTESLAKLEQDTRRIVAELSSNRTALIVGDDGSSAAYLVDPKTYETALNRLSLIEEVALGERDIHKCSTPSSSSEISPRAAAWSLNFRASITAS